ncbi:rhomboid family intramembrane serine protease [Candidatus Woesearchaeota archaeon]|nr:rhomboid family intramembrane serine protease [Candidatus Woesearchaeota archaeon]
MRRFTGFRSAALVIIGINVFLFMLQMIMGDWFTTYFMFDSTGFLSRPWMLLTHMFLHGGPYHLLFNMYALLLFGPLVESRIGSKRFLLIYFLSGILAAAGYLALPTKALGASGAVMGIIGVTVMLMPNLRLLFFFVIPMTLRTAAFFFVIIDLWGVFFQPGVANFAHLVGLACGLGYGAYLLKKKGKFSDNLIARSAAMISGKKSASHKGSHGSSRKTKTGMELSKKDMDDYLRYGRL